MTTEVTSVAASIWQRLEKLDADDLLKPSEVAKLFRVDPKTVTRWAARARIHAIRTPGGHRRFRVGDVRTFLVSEEANAR